MNIDDLKTLPRYIEAPGGGMWKILSDFEIINCENVFVKLDDVKALLSRRKEIENML